MSSNKTINCYCRDIKKTVLEMKASLYFNILETIAENLYAPIEFIPISKTKASSYHLELTSETISDSAECYAGLLLRFESSATCM